MSEFKGVDAPAPIAAPSATVMAATPPPPPPPPAPAAQDSEKAEAQDIVLTGSRIARPNLQKRSENRERPASDASPLAATDGNREFLSRLQSAVRRDDKPGVLRLVGLPLRVNFDAGPKTYSDRKSIGRDFDLIFTPRVRRVILNQRADGLFTNDQGAMIGDGELWFDAKCDNRSCSRKGEILITAVNP